mmetsp:Transcript_15410/g.21992  ORF Transcript_15410/g.21992 Transcript_15410/m.21992 type:complete len:220 (+) Transcript_15410:101-760(+)
MRSELYRTICSILLCFVSVVTGFGFTKSKQITNRYSLSARAQISSIIGAVRNDTLNVISTGPSYTHVLSTFKLKHFCANASEDCGDDRVVVPVESPDNENVEDLVPKKIQEFTDTNDQSYSLNVMLENARKRQNPSIFLWRIQAFLGAPLVLPPSVLSSLTRADVLLCLVAIRLGSIGFAVGLLTGKISVRYVRKLITSKQVIIELWPVVLAILLDQII